MSRVKRNILLHGVHTWTLSTEIGHKSLVEHVKFNTSFSLHHLYLMGVSGVGIGPLLKLCCELDLLTPVSNPDTFNLPRKTSGLYALC